MEAHLENRSPAHLNFILICQDFASPSTLQMYLESKACTVVQQDETIVAIGATKPYDLPHEIAMNGISANAASHRDVEIHAYMRLPSMWRAGLPSGLRTQETRTAAYTPAQTVDSKEEKLCVGFIKALNIVDPLALNSYRFYEDALAHVRSAYIRHERHAAATSTITIQDAPKPVRESFYLTTREHQILKWVSEGKGCWETGAILGISERTVKFHLQNIYRKLNVVNRAQAITKAMRYALI